MVNLINYASSLCPSFNSVKDAVCLKNEKVNQCALIALGSLLFVACGTLLIGLTPTCIVGGIGLAIELILMQTTKTPERTQQTTKTPERTQTEEEKKERQSFVELYKKSRDSLKKEINKQTSTNQEITKQTDAVYQTLHKTYKCMLIFDELQASIKIIHDALTVLSNQNQNCIDANKQKRIPLDDKYKENLFAEFYSKAEQVLPLLDEVVKEIKKNIELKIKETAE